MASDSNGRKPAFNVYFVKSIPGQERGIWSRIGAAWPTKSGEREGYHVLLDLIPAPNVPGRIYMMEPFPEEEAAAASVAEPEPVEESVAEPE